MAAQASECVSLPRGTVIPRISTCKPDFSWWRWSCGSAFAVLYAVAKHELLLLLLLLWCCKGPSESCKRYMRPRNVGVDGECDEDVDGVAASGSKRVRGRAYLIVHICSLRPWGRQAQIAPLHAPHACIAYPGCMCRRNAGK